MIKPFLCRTFLCLLFSALPVSAATVRFAWTNYVGVADTNWFLVYPVNDVADAGGSFITKGPALRLTPNTSGLVTNNLEVGTYVASNRFLARGIAFRVPNDHGPTVYCATCGTNNTPQGTGLAISGFNQFVTIVYGTNPPPTYDEITNSLGFLPVHPSRLNTNELFDLEGDLTVSGISHILVDPDASLDATLNWSDMTLLNHGTNVLDWFNQWLIGRWTANGALFTNIPQSGVVGLENALTYLTNNISGGGGSATNAISNTNGVGYGTTILQQVVATNFTGNAAGLTNFPPGLYAFPRPTTNVNNVTNLILAVNYSAPGAVVGIEKGIYNLGTNNLVPPDGVSVVGSATDPYDVILLGYADCWGVESWSQPSGGPQMSPGNNQFLGGFVLRCDTNTMLAQYPAFYGTNVPHSLMWAGFGMSVLNPPTNRKATNTVVRNVIVERGYFDCFHFNNNFDKQNEITFVDCGAETEGLAWDFWSATSGGTNSTYNLINCWGITRGQIPQRLIDQAALFDPSIILLSEGVTVNTFNFRGRAIYGSGSYTNLASGVLVSSDSRLHLRGGKINVDGIPWDNGYTNLNIHGDFHWNTRRINREKVNSLEIAGVPNATFTLGPAEDVFGALGLVYNDGLDVYDLFRWNGGTGFYFDTASKINGNGALLTNLPVVALRRADGVPLENGTAGQLLTSLGTGGAGWSNFIAHTGMQTNQLTTNVVGQVIRGPLLATNYTVPIDISTLAFSTAHGDSTSWGFVYDDTLDRFNILKFDVGNGLITVNPNMNLSGRGELLTGDDEAYGVGWNGDTTLPTKNAVYDKIETISGGGGGNAWLTNGNSGLPAGSFLGTLDNFDLILRSSNSILADFSGRSNTITLGTENLISGWQPYSVIGGGAGHSIFGPTNSSFHYRIGGNVIGGGYTNTIIGGLVGANVIGGGRFNLINDEGANANVISGGQNNISSNSANTTIGGGSNNEIGGPGLTANFGTIGGGYLNRIPGAGSANLTNEYATVSGGHSNRATGAYSAIPGGNQNQASGSNSIAMGFKARALHPGSVVVSADVSATTGQASPADNSFTVNASGGINLLGSSITGNAAGLTNYGGVKIWEGLVSQSGTSNPTDNTPTGVANNLGTITWARTGVGTYTATISPAASFTANKTVVYVGTTLSEGNGSLSNPVPNVRTAHTSTSVITFTTRQVSPADLDVALSDEILATTSVLIKVYP